MKKRVPVLISFGLLLLSLSIILAACSQSSASTNTPGSSGSPTSGNLDGATLLQQRCTVCHSASRITQASGTADQWASVVDTMIGHGAQLNSTERQTLIDYLAQTYP